MGLREENGLVPAIESAVTEGDVRDQEAATESTGREAGIGTGNGTESVIARGREIVIATGNVITAKHIHGNDHEAGRGIVNAKEIANIESEAEKKVRHVSQPGQE